MSFLSENRFLADLWNALSSWYAMIVYAAVLVVLIIFLIITAMNFELRSTRKVIEKKIDTEHTTIETIQANAAEIEGGGVGIIAGSVSGASASAESGEKVRFDKLC
ncbi:MAG: hypothetical protein J1F33_07945, partial [Clostridiales bacterium]|nr:hypothetical protein [Clostridiales bacterium]